jgi:uncharacterized membrane protein HdeD (DUF308 family)
MAILPRLARALNQPMISAILGLVLIAVAIVGMATDDISTRFGIIIGVVGVINVIRTFAERRKAKEE